MVEMEGAWRYDKGRAGETVESDGIGCRPAENPSLGCVWSVTRVRDPLFLSAAGAAGVGGAEGS